MPDNSSGSVNPQTPYAVDTDIDTVTLLQIKVETLSSRLVDSLGLIATGPSPGQNQNELLLNIASEIKATAADIDALINRLPGADSSQAEQDAELAALEFEERQIDAEIEVELARSEALKGVIESGYTEISDKLILNS